MTLQGILFLQISLLEFGKEDDNLLVSKFVEGSETSMAKCYVVHLYKMLWFILGPKFKVKEMCVLHGWVVPQLESGHQFQLFKWEKLRKYSMFLACPYTYRFQQFVASGSLV